MDWERLVYFRYTLQGSSGATMRARSECGQQDTLPKAQAGTVALGLARRIAWAKIPAEYEARRQREFELVLQQAEERRRQEAAVAARLREARRHDEAEKARRHRELEIVRQRAVENRRELMAREQQRLKQERRVIFAKSLEEYIGAVESSVARNWRRPTGVPPGLKCTVSLVQATNGQVLHVEIAQSSGNIAFDRSVEQAVLAASPLPLPKQPAVFDRELVILFKPRS